MIAIRSRGRRHALPGVWARLMTALAGDRPVLAPRPERVYTPATVRRPFSQGDTR